MVWRCCIHELHKNKHYCSVANVVEHCGIAVALYKCVHCWDRS